VGENSGLRKPPHKLQDAKQVQDSHPSRNRQSVEGALKRLHTDVIDLYYQHRVDTQVQI
jgi:aryl-alcohol dehydrogenase-like predicted oxidoreductase